MKTTNTRRRKRRSGNGFPWKKIGIAAAIIVGIAVIVSFIFIFPYIFKDKDADNSVTISYTSSLMTNTTHTVDSDSLNKAILDLVQKGTGINVNFTVENGNGLYTSKFSIEATDLKVFNQTNQRADYFRLKRKAELQGKIAVYNEALQAKPCRAIFIGVDVTEGYKEKFAFSEYLNTQDIQWLNDPGKQTTLYVYSIGYNPIPGCISWENTQGTTTVAGMESRIQKFLEPVKQPLPNTALLSQVHFILDKMRAYYQPLFVLNSDMLENTKELSAYRDDQANKDFVALKSEFIESYKTNAATAAQVTIDPSTTGEVRVLLPSQQNSALGREAKKQQWYTAIKTYLQSAYPQVKVSMSF